MLLTFKHRELRELCVSMPRSHRRRRRWRWVRPLASV